MDPGMDPVVVAPPAVPIPTPAVVPPLPRVKGSSLGHGYGGYPGHRALYMSPCLRSDFPQQWTATHMCMHAHTYTPAEDKIDL